MSRAVRRSLEEAGRRSVPPLDPSFAKDLEARLVAVAATAPPPPEPSDGRPRSQLRPAIAAAGLAMAVVALGLVAVISRPVPSIELIAPSNVQVALGDGTILEDPGGLLLPDGAVVTVGPRGSARIGETLLLPGDVATVRDGRLQVQHDPAIGVVSGAPATAPPRTTNAPLSSAPTSSPHDTVTAGPAGGSPSPALSSPGPTSRQEPSHAPATDVTATPAPTPATVRPRLKVRLIEGHRIAVTWTATLGAQRYLLVVSASRSGAAPQPVYPGSRVLGEFAAPPMPRLRYRVPARVEEVRLMVVALRDDGSVLRRSRVVTITMPPTGDTAGSSPDAGATPTPTPTLKPTTTPTPTPSL